MNNPTLVTTIEKIGADGSVWFYALFAGEDSEREYGPYISLYEAREVEEELWS